MDNDPRVKDIIDAAGYGDIAALNRFISEGIDVNTRSENGLAALYYASLAGQISAMRVLIDNGAEVDIVGKARLTPLMAASRNCILEGMSLLSGNGASVHKSDSTGMIPLHFASRNNTVPSAVRLLLEAGSMVNALTLNKETPLLVAAGSNSIRPAEILLSYGADPNIANDAGETAIFWAKDRNSRMLIELLERHGAKT